MGKGDTAEKLVIEIRRETRCQLSANEKLRAVLEGLRGGEWHHADSL